MTHSSPDPVVPEELILRAAERILQNKYVVNDPPPPFMKRLAQLIDDAKLVASALLAAVPPRQEEKEEGLGLSIDMLDVDRLRDWARLILEHGSDISRWGDRFFVASKMQIMATSIEKAIRDIGTLRAALSPHQDADRRT